MSVVHLVTNIAAAIGTLQPVRMNSWFYTHVRLGDSRKWTPLLVCICMGFKILKSRGEDGVAEGYCIPALAYAFD